jgi:uncharacterized protein YdbL (DUF1318 family)
MRAAWRVVAAAALALASAGTASAADPPAVAAARVAGTIGERFDGYIGYVTAVPEAVRRQVDTINIRRRSLYIALAGQRGVTAEEVGITAGCQLLALVQPGAMYLLGDGKWRRRSGTERITPDYCG